MKSALGFILVLAATPVLAQPSPVPTTTGSPNDAATAIANQLGLDATTAAVVAQTFAKYDAQLAPIEQAQRAARQALAQALATAQPDPTQLTQLANQLTSARPQVEAIEAQRLAELQQELTPVQFGKLLLAHRHGGGYRPGGQPPSGPPTAPQQ